MVFILMAQWVRFVLLGWRSPKEKQVIYPVKQEKQNRRKVWGQPMTTHHHFVSTFVSKSRWPVYFPVGENTPRAQIRGVRQDHSQAEREPQRQSGHHLRQRGRHQVSVGWALTTRASFESLLRHFPITTDFLCPLITLRFFTNPASPFLWRMMSMMNVVWKH